MTEWLDWTELSPVKSFNFISDAKLFSSAGQTFSSSVFYLLSSSLGKGWQGRKTFVFFGWLQSAFCCFSGNADGRGCLVAECRRWLSDGVPTTTFLPLGSLVSDRPLPLTSSSYQTTFLAMASMSAVLVGWFPSMQFLWIHQPYIKSCYSYKVAQVLTPTSAFSVLLLPCSPSSVHASLGAHMQDHFLSRYQVGRKWQCPMCTHLHFTHMILLYIPDQPWAYVTR